MAIGYELSTEFSDTVKARFWVPEAVNITRSKNLVKVVWIGYVNKDAYIKGNPHITVEVMQHTIAEVFDGAAASALVTSLETAALNKLGWTNATTETENAFYVTYDGNGATEGTPPVDENWYELGDQVTILGESDLSNNGFIFDGWNTEANGTGQTVQPTTTVPMPGASTILYAQWVES